MVGSFTRGWMPLIVTTIWLIASVAQGDALAPFEIVAQTGSQPRIVLIGNTHDSAGKETEESKIAKAQNSALLDQLGSDGDILLLEGSEAGQPATLDGRTLNLPNKFTLLGWDNFVAHQLAQEFLEDIEEFKRSGNPYWMVRMLQLENINMRQRNKFLFVTASEQAKRNPSKTVFVLAGTLHANDPFLIENLKNSQIPFIVYAPKGYAELFKADQKNLDLFRTEIRRLNPEYDIEKGLQRAADVLWEHVKPSAICTLILKGGLTRDQLDPRK